LMFIEIRYFPLKNSELRFVVSAADVYAGKQIFKLNDIG